MQAMELQRPGERLTLVDRPDPQPSPREVRVRVSACGVCRTDLHVVDGELSHPKLPIVPGHEIVGRVDLLGTGVERLSTGMRVGIPWLGWTCGWCRYCLEGRENLCDSPQFTGYTRDGGYATHVVADARFVFPLPAVGDDVATAPLLCAGLIGWRSLRMASDGKQSAFTASALLRISLRRSPLAGPRGVRLYAVWRYSWSGLRTQIGCLLGRLVRGSAARGAGLRDHLCAGRGIGAGGTQGRSKGRPRCLRGHPHE